GIKDNSCPRTGIPEFLVILSIMSALSGTFKGSLWSKTRTPFFHGIKVGFNLVYRTPVNLESRD
ncbi:hypothetical protein DHB64_15090, partial [Antarcticibacterium sp. W02-3]|nr:hypothetical protein [Antarcticibacterium sp. W02-3]